MKIEYARKADYPELMDMMVQCFRVDTKDHPRFEVFLPDLYQPTSALMKCCRIIREKGKIVSAVGLYPISLRFGGLRVRVAGIGGVCTLPQARGKGYMSALLKRIRTEAEKEGYSFSWLSGIRDRYAHYDWEKAGADLEYRVCAKQQRKFSNHWKIERLDPAGPSVEKMFLVHQELVSAGECTPAEFRLKLQRDGLETWTAEHRSGEFAYLCFNRKKGWMTEWGGDPEGVQWLIEKALGGKESSARLPNFDAQYRELFERIGEKRPCPEDNLSILNLKNLLRAYEPFLKPRWPADRSLVLIMKRCDGKIQRVILAGGKTVSKPKGKVFEIACTDLEMTRLLFGPDKPSKRMKSKENLEWLDMVLPLPFFMPSLFRV